ncbi:EcoKI restriction-modification system protein HsdS [Lacticaseibacillus paracasei]|uniref:restriction endonuclease subunit S n=1 Tax=Lacticaseibacillus paracasei TaxID=1597 RepID=UPI000FF80D30|nr:restriction endonuclease subunit S [Lacticaseibacillus paracasei]MDM7527543.1 restriction endonuclease subunit S [Lacticaseibacillus paracasei]RNE11070.1 EcoKI restriction-modification system protein HsdS [Lacticaseibacillus paracasei]
MSEVTNLITKGTTPREKGGRGEVNFIKVENLSKNGNIFTTSKVSVSEHQGYLARSILQENDILFSIAGSLGRTAIVPKLVLPANTNQALAIIRLSTGCVEFVATYLSGEAIDRYIRRNPTVGAQPNISLTQVASLQIDWPSLHEQEVISKLFARVKDLIAATQDKIGALEQVKETLSKNLFDQSWRFKEYSTPWKENKLKDIVSAYSGGTPSANIRTYYGGHIPFIRSAEIHSSTTALTLTQEGLKNSSAKLVKTGDILYALYGANSGDVDRSKINGAINQAILAMRPSKENDSNFILFQLMRMKNKIVSTYLQGGQGNLSGRIILALNLDMPESTSEQRTIGRSLQLLCELISVNQSKYSQLESLKKSLLQNLFV